MLFGCLVWMSSALSQERTVGIGADASLWASGWKNVHVAVVLQDEVRLHGGLGLLSEATAEQGIHFRPRPQHFNSAMQYSLGLRVIPRANSGQRWSELFGIELAGECFKKSPVEWMGRSGTMAWNRTDARVIVGAECRIHQNFSVSAHLGLGRSVVQGGEGFDEDLFEAVENSPGMTRMLGLELLFWL